MCARQPQPLPSGDRWHWVEMVARQHLRLCVIAPHPLATTQPPSGSPSRLMARSQPQTTYTHMLQGPMTEPVSWNPALFLTATSRINLLLTWAWQSSFWLISAPVGSQIRAPALSERRAGKDPEPLYSQSWDSHADRQITCPILIVSKVLSSLCWFWQKMDSKGILR